MVYEQDSLEQSIFFPYWWKQEKRSFVMTFSSPLPAQGGSIRSIEVPQPLGRDGMPLRKMVL